ncbi:MAG: hypothetical protein HFJ59_02180 [Clostridia bacterium]|nr:hypothetical protein [Clostridia bacterium]
MVEELKMKYNYILNRYYNGCNYVEAHPEEFNKYIDKIMQFKTELDELIKIIEKKQRISKEEILGGFKIC